MTAGGFSLAGRRVMLTGATGHLGRAMARALCAAGADVHLVARDAAACDALRDELAATGGTAVSAACDVTDADAVAALMAGLGDGPLHGLVNNAYSGGAGSLETARDEEWRTAYEVAVVASQRLISTAHLALRRARTDSGDAAIVNVGSMYGVVSPDPRLYDRPEAANPPFYGAAKAALAQLSRYAACELGPEGIRVNTLVPGPFPSDAVQSNAPAFVARLASRLPLGRIGRAEEIGGPLVFLLSPAASFVTGATLCVDGGWTSW